MSHKRGRDKRAKAKQEIRSLYKLDMEMLRSGDYMANLSFHAALKFKMKSFYFRWP